MYGASPGNAHVNLIRRDGTLGARVERYNWTRGWTQAVPYVVDGNAYLLLLREHDYEADGNNVHIHRLRVDGAVGARVASYCWTQGWSTVSVYSAGGSTYVLLLKGIGYGADGNNVHVHRMEADGSIGPRIASYRWTQGWTEAVAYTAGAHGYLLLLKEAGSGADGKNVHIHKLDADGSVGARVHSREVMQGYAMVCVYPSDGRLYMLSLRSRVGPRDLESHPQASPTRDSGDPQLSSFSGQVSARPGAATQGLRDASAPSEGEVQLGQILRRRRATLELCPESLCLDLDREGGRPGCDCGSAAR